MLNSTHQGLIALPVILTSRDQGLFNTLEKQSADISVLKNHFRENSVLATLSLDVLMAIGWLRLDEYEKYSLTEQASDYDKLPRELWELFTADVETLLDHRQQQKLRHYLDQSRQNWQINNLQLVEFLDNALAHIVLLALHAKYLLTPEKIAFNKLSPELRRELIRFFKQHHCLQQTELTETGKTLVQSVLHHAPLLLACHDLLAYFVSTEPKNLDLNPFLLLQNAKTDGDLFLNSCQTLAQHAWGYDLLVQAAGQGLFPDNVLNPKQFVQRDYQIRPAQLSDLPALVELETLCWATALQKPVSVLEQRLRQYPEGQLVLVMNALVVGVIYSQRLSDESLIYQHSTHDIESLHDEQGSIVQLLAVNVLPSMQQQNLGDQLLEFILQTCHLRTDIAKVVAVTLCKNYQQHSELSIANYIQARNAQGSLLDPVLRFHELHGANIVGLVANYRPEDVNNQGYGVLVSYNLEQRQRTEVAVQSEAKVLSYAELQTGLESIILNCLGKQRAAAFAFDRPMMEMGLDSADLLAIQEKIVHQYQVPLKAAFFFQYNTPAKVLAYLAELTNIITTVQTESITPTHTEPTSQHQDIAIIGMSCRLPKGINSPEQLWQVLSAGENLIGDLPAERWQWSDDIDPVEKHRGIAKGGFLTDIKQFDAPFFRISPKEAEAMDPQQRLLLELAWHTLEHAGYTASNLTASNTGVFIGASGSDYSRLWDQARLPIDAHCSTGGSMAVLANRLSYFFDFQGPSLLIDTACSSSLVAVHQAVEALQANECTQALVGGINILCHPANSIAYYKAGMLAKDGLCKTFDKNADGYGRSEGAVMLLLKPLNAALADNDNIYAVIKGSACNHGGQASGLTVPNPNQQAVLLQKAWQSANICPTSLNYVEAHGTGTALGDPIEIQGLQTAWSQVSNAKSCGIGSIKTNLGHLEAAAGITGLLKVVLCLQHRQLVPSLHFKQLNPHIDLNDSAFYVVQSLQDWTAVNANQPRRAGVSSFGSGGTNAHVIVEEFIAPSIRNTPHTTQPLVFVLSAKNKTQLQQYAQQYLAWLNTVSPQPIIEDLVYSSQLTRLAMEQRLALIVTSIEDLIEQLQQFCTKNHANYQHNIKTLNVSSAVTINAQTSVEQLAELWTTGAFYDWSFLYRDLAIEQRPQRIVLPLYPFAKHQYWLPKEEPIEQTDSVCETHSENPDKPICPTALTAVWQTVAIANAYSLTQNIAPLVIIGGTLEQQQQLTALYPHAYCLSVETTVDSKNLSQQLNTLGEFSHLLWIVEDSANDWHSDTMIAAQQQGVLALFNTLKALLALGYENKTLNWTVVTTKTQSVFPNDTLNATHAGVHGLMAALAKEYPRWQIRLVDVADHHWLSQNLFALPVEQIGETWAYRHQQWWQRSFIPVTQTTQRPPAYRQHGVYVVIGGAGGIGEAWTEYMIEQYQAQIIWLGRRAKDQSIQAKLERLARTSLAPCYIQADASDLSALQRAYTEIKQTYPHIHGVIHAAVGIFDDSLATMSVEHFRQVLSAKLDVSVHLSQVFSAEDLDFLLFFSSIVSLEKNGGLSGYATGCNFMDAFAQQLAKDLPYAVKVMNWGHWRIGTGDSISNATKIRLQRSGIVAIEPEEAMTALQTLLASPLTQLVLVKTQRLETMPFIQTSESLHLYPDSGASCLSALAALSDDSAELINALKPDGIFQNPDMNAKLLPLFAGILNAHGWLDDEHTAIASCYQRWLMTSRQLLKQHSYQTQQTLDDFWTEWHQTKSNWNTTAVTLVEACLNALPDILTGKQQATEIMFPNASMERVQGIYKDNSVADYFNNALADRVVAVIQARLQDNPDAKIRILEIGAGTGGTTAKVLPKLTNYRAHIAEYCYTDVSKAFLFHAQEHFVNDYPFVVTQLFDVEKPLSNQTINVGQYDIVIATNVLHATHNIRQTLNNTKALLRTSGILLLNEIIEHSLFAHLTFGLLLGWWLAEDEPLRIAGSPCLTADTWQNVLQQQGFNSVLLPNQHAQILGQQLIIAESNGIVRHASSLSQMTEHTPVTVMTKTVIDSTELQEKSCQLLKKLVAKTLRMNSDELDANEPLEIYGIDSILIVQITNNLRESFGEVSRTLLFEYQTVAALTDYFMREHQDSLLKLTGVKARVTETPVQNTPVVNQEVPESTPTTFSTLANEPIAVIGISCRFPQAETADAFWTLLKEGRDCVTEIPKERWNIDGFFHSDPDEAVAQGKSYSKWGAFLENATQFDPQFFNISPKEAVTIDPQERLFLQATWSALEDAGYTRACLHKKFKQRVGVFAGITRTGFDLFGPALWQQGSTLYPHTAFSSTANRVSYFLNLKGPSYAVDTMCSSSLTAIHQACQQLRLQECEIAIAGGVNLYLHSSSYVGLSASRMLSKDGRCKSFAKGGNGFVPGEGVGVVILKPLSKAIADKDNIYAVIRSTHVNHGGKTNGYTVPNPNAQAELIRESLDKAQVNARTVSYIEAHGTGTELGDPIEITGLTQAFKQDTHDVGFCALGSVKTNVGHLEASAGIVGFIKVILQMKHGQLVKSLHAEQTNPAIDFAKTPFVLQQQLSAWQRPIIEVNGVKQEYPRIAGISSFGAGGVNAHVILEEYQSATLPVSASDDYLMVLSAKNSERLQAYARKLLAFLSQHPDIDLADLAYTLQTGREAMEERLAFVASSYAEVLEKLQSFIDQTPNESDVFTGQIHRHKEILAIFAHDPQMDKTIAAWMQQRNTSKLLNLWTKGLSIDWQQFYQTPVAQGYRMPKRISLPTYPFLETTYWLPEPAVKASVITNTLITQVSTKPAVVTEPVAVTAPLELKPVVQKNTESKTSALIELTTLSNISTQFTPPQTPQLRTLSSLTETDTPKKISTDPMQLDLQSHGQGVFSIVLRNPNQQTLALTALTQGLNHCFNQLNNLAHTENAPKVVLLKGLEQLHIDDSAFHSALQQLPQLMAKFDLPLIAVLQQNCTGIALLMAMLSDSVIVDIDGQYTYRTNNTAFSQQEAQLFIERFGEKLGLHWLSSANTYTGKHAQNLGCQWSFLPAPELNDSALLMAASIANRPRIALTELRKQLALPFVNLTHALTQTLSTYTAIPAKTDELAILTPLDANMGRVKTIALDSEVVHLAAYDNGVVVMTLADKTSKNTFSPAFVNGVITAFEHIRQNPAYKVVVLTGYDNYFACGGTKEGLLAIQSGQARFTDEQSYSLPLLCDIPVIAAMQGHGIGAGWAMGLFCDTAIYSAESSYQSPYMLYGFTPGAGSTLIFPHRLGYDLSHEVLFTAQPYKGTALKQRGLKNLVLPRTEVLSYALGLANRLALTPREILIQQKEQRSRYLRQQLPNTFTQELAMHDKTFIGSQAVIDNIEQHFNTLLNADVTESNKTTTPVNQNVHANLAEIVQMLRNTLCDELSMQINMVQDEQTFIDMGMDSISAVTWIRKLNKHYGLNLAATKVYSHPTIALLAKHIFTEISQTSAPLTQQVQQHHSCDDADELLKMLRDSLANELSLPLDGLNEDTTFIDMGMDSISAVTWVRKINERYQLAIGATKIYSYPTLRDFHRYVWQEAKQQGVFQTTQTAIAEPVAPPVVCCKPPVVIHSYELSAVPDNIQTVKVTETEPESEPEPVIKPVSKTQTVQAEDNAIAVIGMSGRFPKASNINEFWQNLVEGRDCISEIPAERWQIDDFYSTNKLEAGKTVCRNMGAVDDVDAFEPLFFNISPQEAELMDPQQRLFLQACWHSIEDAGYRPSQLSGMQCGVFAGCGTGDYSQGLDTDAPSAQVLMGETVAMLPARISYLLNLQGPCLAIDTACSSSLVAIATACDNLLLGNCDLALAGGVYVLAGPDIHIKMSQSGMLSPDGRCFTFDQRANGFVPGEGVGVLLLKRLSQAEQDGDDIYGVIRAWGVNQDGKTNGITAPNPVAQTRLEKNIYQRFNINPEQIELLEAHGTGTKLGDPIEVEALRETFSSFTNKKNYCALGSVKSNIGHLATAAGVSGVIKALLALQHRTLPPTINYQTLNEHIQLNNSAFYINTQCQEWQTPANGQKRLAAVSSFGFSGTNAHFVLEEYVKTSTTFTTPASCVCVLSAKTPEQLQQYAQLLTQYLAQHPDAPLTDIAYTLQTGRDAMPYRLAIIATDKRDLSHKLSNYSDNAECFTSFVETENRQVLASTERDLHTIAQHWLQGGTVDWSTVNAQARRLHGLPVYPFAKERYWLSKLAKQPQKTTAQPDIEPQTPSWQVCALAKNIDWNQHLQHYQERAISIIYEQEHDKATLEQLLTQMAQAAQLSKPLTLHFVNVDQLNCQTFQHPVDVVLLLADEQSDLAILKKLLTLLANKQYTPRLLGLFANGLEFTELTQTLNQYDCTVISAAETLDSLAKVRTLLTEWLAIDDTADATGLVQVRYQAGQRLLLNQAFFHHFIHKNWQEKTLAPVNVNTEYQRCVILVNQHSAKIAEQLTQFAPFANSIIIGDKHPPLIDYKSIESSKVCANNLLAQIEDVSLLIDLSDMYDTHRERDIDQLGKLSFYQALLRSYSPLNILYFTKGLQYFRNPKMTLAGAKFAGLIKMLSADYAHVKARFIDIDCPIYEQPQQLLNLINQELHSDLQETEICYRQGQRFVPSLQLGQHGQATGLTLSNDGVYVISGGTNGIGLALAQYLVEQGCKKLVLMGSQALPDKAEWQTAITEPQSLSYPVPPALKAKLTVLSQLDKTVELRIYTGSLNDTQVLTEYFQHIRQQLGVIKGVIHSAAVYSDASKPDFVSKNPNHSRQIQAVKVNGLEQLHAVLQQDPLDFFVSFSSLAGVIPRLARGASDYAMANNFLEFFNAYQAQQHPKTQYKTITFADWHETGALSRVNSDVLAGVKQTFKDIGLRTFSNKEGYQLFASALQHEGHWLFPAYLNRARFQSVAAQLLFAQQPTDNTKQDLLSHLQQWEHEKQAGQLIPITRVTEIISFEEIKQLSPDLIHRIHQVLFNNATTNTTAEKPSKTETDNQTTVIINKTVCEVLKLSQLDPRKPFQNYGLDSISAMVVATRLEKQLQQDIQPRWLIDFSTVETLSAHLQSQTTKQH